VCFGPWLCLYSHHTYGALRAPLNGLTALRLQTYRRSSEALVGGGTIWGMAKDHQINASSNGATSNGARPYLGLSDAARAEQQKSLQEYADELRAEGADGSSYLPELEAQAATWPE
jgi:phage gpG-like protein